MIKAVFDTLEEAVSWAEDVLGGNFSVMLRPDGKYEVVQE